MNIRPIKTDRDNEAALRRIEVLMDAKPGTAEMDELDVLASLVEQYEEKRFSIDAPSPIDAIRFRMEQADLSPRDLVPFLGSRAKVSEVLSGKRPLTLQMIRALHEHLGIPADSLLKVQGQGTTLPENLEGIEWSRFPLNEMAKRCWIPKGRNLKDRAEEIMRPFIDAAGGPQSLALPLYRKNDGARQNARMDLYALKAWCYRLLAIARQTALPHEYRDGSINEKFARGLVNLSWLPDGPKLAKAYLADHGIHLIYLPHLTGTHLDGAALKQAGTPVIGLTLRYDRVDNFWFCLCHEIAHIKFHLRRGQNEAFVDDLSLETQSETDLKEQEANKWAQDTLIPPDVWESARAKREVTPSAVVELAQRLRIHPAIIAGRIRKDRRNYRLLSHYVGNGDVRKHFDEAA
jgi:HTH-type transcriptional regulator/antitoxin HigA